MPGGVPLHERASDMEGEPSGSERRPAGSKVVGGLPSAPTTQRWASHAGIVMLLLHGACAGSSDPSPTSAARPTGADRYEACPGMLVVPTRYHEDRFIARPVVARTGEVIELYLDTGGNSFLYADVVDRLGLRRVRVRPEPGALDEVQFPAVSPRGSMPLPHTRDGRVLVMERDTAGEGYAGMLGPEWFGGRRWLFDYPGRRLVLLRGRCHLRLMRSAHVVRLGFAEGLHFPRIQATIDGETLNLLLDTGAHTRLAPEAHATLADGREPIRATSFITSTVFRRWERKHPDWQVVRAAEMGSGQPMIRVPRLTVAGYTVGPVWFTRRADRNFHDFMSRWMDRRIDGALGGNALRHFRVEVDYPRQRAAFAKD